MLFLKRFGVTSPDFGQAVHAQHSRQCCDMRFLLFLFFVFILFICFVLFCLFVWKVEYDSLERCLWERGISATGLEKQSSVRLYTYVNDILIELRAVWQIKQLKKPRTIKKEIMVEKRNLEKVGRWERSKWAERLNILAIATHAKQIKTQKKYIEIPAYQAWKYYLKWMPPN